MTVTPTTPQTTIPGLTQTVTMPANSVVLITSDGEMSTTSAASTGFSVVDIFISIDGAVVPNGGYQRVIAANSTGGTNRMQSWSLSLSATLTVLILLK